MGNKTNLLEVKKNQTQLDEFSKYFEKKEIDIILSGKKLYEDTKKKLLIMDSTDVDLLLALNTIDQFFEEKEDGLIIDESVELHHRISLEFANHFDGVQGKFMESFNRDLDVREALNYLSDEQAYDHVFSVENLSE